MIDYAGMKACRGIYSVGDTAKHYGVSKGTVWNVWNNVTHADVKPSEAPYIQKTRVPWTEIREEYSYLNDNGYTIETIAKRIGVSVGTVKKAIKEVAAA